MVSSLLNQNELTWYLLCTDRNLFFSKIPIILFEILNDLLLHSSGTVPYFM